MTERDVITILAVIGAVLIVAVLFLVQYALDHRRVLRATRAEYLDLREERVKLDYKYRRACEEIEFLGSDMVRAASQDFRPIEYRVVWPPSMTLYRVNATNPREVRKDYPAEVKLEGTVVEVCFRFGFYDTTAFRAHYKSIIHRVMRALAGRAVEAVETKYNK